MRIYLIGFMGSGKTTLGRLLATRLDYAFLDLDKQIEEGEERTIEQIFAEPQGESTFRILEHTYLKKVAVAQPNAVISTGGGTPCYNDNMMLMNADGVTVYLKLTPERLAARLSSARVCRPLLRGKSDVELVEYITATLSAREPYYAQANVTVIEPTRDAERLLHILEPYLQTAQ